MNYFLLTALDGSDASTTFLSPFEWLNNFLVSPRTTTVTLNNRKGFFFFKNFKNFPLVKEIIHSNNASTRNTTLRFITTNNLKKKEVKFFPTQRVMKKSSFFDYLYDEYRAWWRIFHQNTIQEIKIPRFSQLKEFSGSRSLWKILATMYTVSFFFSL